MITSDHAWGRKNVYNTHGDWNIIVGQDECRIGASEFVFLWHYFYLVMKVRCLKIIVYVAGLALALKENSTLLFRNMAERKREDRQCACAMRHVFVLLTGAISVMIFHWVYSMENTDTWGRTGGAWQGTHPTATTGSDQRSDPGLICENVIIHPYTVHQPIKTSSYKSIHPSGWVGVINFSNPHTHP